MKKRGRPAGKTDPDTRYKMWLCYLLASECPEGDELPLQHDGAFEVVGKPWASGQNRSDATASKLANCW
jgi:hypothetical protein